MTHVQHLLWRHIVSVVFAVDFALAVAAGVATFVAVDAFPVLAENSTGPLSVAIAVGMAGIGMAVNFLRSLQADVVDDDVYRRALSKVSGGERAAYFPFQFTAGVAAATVLLAAAQILLAPVLEGRGKAVLMAVTAGAFVWSVLGLALLVRHNASHARLRSRLKDTQIEARRELKRQRDAG